MSREMSFLIYCIEIYKKHKSLNGRQTLALFNKYGVTDYVTRFFEALHTTGTAYILDDIDSFIAERETTSAK